MLATASYYQLTVGHGPQARSVKFLYEMFYCTMEVERNRTYTIKQSDYLLEILNADLAKRYMLSTPVDSGTLEERKCDMAAARRHSGSYDGLICACVKLY